MPRASKTTYAMQNEWESLEGFLRAKPVSKNGVTYLTVGDSMRDDANISKWCVFWQDISGEPLNAIKRAPVGSILHMKGVYNYNTYTGSHQKAIKELVSIVAPEGPIASSVEAAFKEIAASKKKKQKPVENTTSDINVDNLLKELFIHDVQTQTQTQPSNVVDEMQVKAYIWNLSKERAVEMLSNQLTRFTKDEAIAILSKQIARLAGGN